MNTINAVLEEQLATYHKIKQHNEEEWGRGDLTDDELSLKLQRLNLQIATVWEIKEALRTTVTKIDDTLQESFKVLAPFCHPDFCQTLPSNGSMGDDAPLFVRNGAMMTIGDCRAASRLHDKVAKLLDGDNEE